MEKKIVHVIDTPGFFDTEITEDKVLTEIIRSCGMVSPGPHVILYVMTIRHRFTNEDARCVDEFVNLFAGNPYKHTIICFTDKDALDHKGKNTFEYLRDVPEPLRNLLKKCGNRTVFFNNISGNTKHQWIELYSVIDKMLKQNNDSFFSNEILVEVEKALVQKMKEDNDPSKVKRLIYKTKRDMANDGSTMSYLKTTLLASGSCGTLMGITVLAGSLIVGHGLVAALVAAKTATFLGSVVGGTVFFAGKMITRTVTTHCSIS
ncbi:unnamed protein product [Mytilus edulis]|uniref:AIG1-type G domain-containing protein n=1 Tax=Mytilus edulis TaxID=6550 RepID=A0A8S3T5V8_MYTED|nr:unnamed protein product [Mytilus edulis]